MGCHSSSLLSVVNLKSYIGLSVELCIKAVILFSPAEINAEHSVSKLVSVILEPILPKVDDWLRHRQGSGREMPPRLVGIDFLLLVLMLMAYTCPH